MAAGGVLGAVLVTVTVCLTSGCSTLGYYAQATGGHLSLMQKSRPVAAWLADPATPAPLRERLQLSQRMRDFAVSELLLPENSSYRRYADLQRSAVVWNVVAAPELSLTLRTWCFPWLGCVGYRGYFSREPADALAAELRGQGLETSVYGVPAYSTLGWTSWLGGDPLLNTFLQWSEGDLARLIFHELAHQVAYAHDDTTFNESFAVAVERIGGARWLQQHASAAAREEDARQGRRRRDFRALTLRTRERLKQVYDSPAPDEQKRRSKVEAMQALRSEYEMMKVEQWGGHAGYDGWVQRANNATLGVQAAYDDLVPAFERLFWQQGGDFARFYAEVQRLAALPKDQRRARLGSIP
ncbi:MAG: aminopeptidase [Chitinophagaceae bacterium]|nr:aminopeptidase [Rubrivivax sp.]